MGEDGPAPRPIPGGVILPLMRAAGRQLCSGIAGDPGPSTDPTFGLPDGHPEEDATRTPGCCCDADLGECAC